ncbi:MAG: hypothetical protein GY786_04575, partial [Proteobacteria bacterium]|nr:hypothetical protein [Pseudomonadota bacterium]
MKKQAVKGLQKRLIQLKQISTLVKQPNGTFKYESAEKKEILGETSLEIKAKGTAIPLPTDKPGDYLLVIVNQKGTELNKLRFSVAGEGDLSAKMDRNAELQIKLNKTDFDPGELVELQIKSPYSGSGLITIERDKVYSYKWFKTDKTSSIQTIKIPKGMEGNGYINVTFVRSINSSEIYMSPLSTAVEPFSINKSERINKVSLEVPELVRPGKDLEIEYTSQNPGKIVIFAVDKGILQVAKYVTPDPLKYFYKKKALEVETRQILDLILPEYSIVTKKLSNPGGGAAGLLAQNLNPFRRKTEKPVVFWSGILDVGKDTQKIKFNIPDYFNGQIKIFAISLTKEAMGVVSDSTFVRGHFVLSPNIPTFVAPKDRFTLSVGISNNVEDSGREAPVNIALNTSKHFEILGDNKQIIEIDQNSEKSAKFEILVKDQLGSGKFILVASLKGRSAKRTIEASIRPPVPYQTKTISGVIERGEIENISTPRDLYPHFHNNEIGISTLPL